MSKITIDDVCRSAWESVRGESATPYDNLEPDYRTKLLTRAEAVLAGEWPQGAWEKFEREVCLLADGRGFMQVGSGGEADPPEPEKPKKRSTRKAK